LILAAAVPAFAASAPVEVRQQGSARLENVPPVQADVSTAVQRYQMNRAAGFEDWLADGSILIGTRFGAIRQLHQVAAPGAARTQLTFGPEPVGNALAIPGTKDFVLSRDTGGDEWFQLYLRGISGPDRQLTETGTRNQSAVVGRDGRLLVWAEARKGSAAYRILGVDPQAPGTPHELHRSDGAVAPAAIAPGNGRLIFLRALSNRENRIFELDLGTGAVTRIAPGASAPRYESVRYSPAAGKLLVISDRDSDSRQLVELDMATGAQRVIAPGPANKGRNWDVEEFDLAPDDHTLAYVLNEDGFSRLHLLDLATGRALPAPLLPGGVLQALRFSPDGRRLAIGFTNATTAGDVWIWDIADAKLVRWTSSELGDLDPASLSEPGLIRFRSFDGESIPAFVYRPKGLGEDVRTPVIIDIHGGPEAQTRPIWNYGAQYFADALKATVILPNVRGSDGYGRRYLNLDNAEKREDSVKDIGALLDWVKSRPDLDSARVAVYGKSYGGYMSLAVMTHYSDRLAGGVARYGISDFTTFLNNTEAYRRDNRRAEYGDERDPRMRKLFARISPMANIAKITKPMLIMQGANDPRVPQSESDQVVAKLRANGNETWYVLFADEGHGFLKKPNNDLRREVETLFLRKIFNKD
jgi:dipeptidyl aminopeptidase/acylaminoacyl peptidase